MIYYVTVCLAFALGSYWIDRKFPKPVRPATPPPECKHDLKIISSQVHLTPEHIAALTEKVTVVLYRCRTCGEHTTACYAGTWTLADFLKETNDIQELEGLLK